MQKYKKMGTKEVQSKKKEKKRKRKSEKRKKKRELKNGHKNVQSIENNGYKDVCHKKER